MRNARSATQVSIRAGHFLWQVVCLVALALGTAPLSAEELATTKCRWSELPPIPDKLGVAGAFAGVHNGALLVAGGANFPGKPPWQGGKKVWHDSVFVLDKPGGIWRTAGRLARPLGYGVSLSIPEGVVCLGGSDAQRHYADAFLMRWERGEIATSLLPPLPRPCANFCGVLLGNTIYVAGGSDSPTARRALRAFWCLNLDAAQPQWRELDPWDGPGRMFAVAAAQDNALFVVSGAELTDDTQGKPVRRYLNDAHRYQPERGWKRIADLPRAAVAAPTPALAVGSSAFLVLGGDDGSLVDFQPPESHPGFPCTILEYNAVRDRWGICGNMPAAQVTTALVHWEDRFVMPTGEVRPGVRSPAVWSVQLLSD